MKIKKAITLLVLLILSGGCATPSLQQDASIHWRELGTPPASLIELERIRRSLPKSLQDPLSDLRSSNTVTRRRAANLFERLGPASAPVTNKLLHAFEVEPDPLTRAFLARAIAELPPEKETVSRLQKVFSQGLHPVLRTYIAGAIVKQSQLQNCENELQYLLDSLNAPTNDAASPAAEQTIDRERCWAAAYMIGKLGPQGAPLASAMERIAGNDTLPIWLQRQLLFTLRQISIKPTNELQQNR